MANRLTPVQPAEGRGPRWRSSARCPPPPTAHETDSAGGFRLDLELPRTRWAERDVISGEARLAVTRGTAALVSGSGNPLAFEYREVGGHRLIEPVWTADCARHSLDVDEPIRTQITKSGTWEEEDDANPGVGRDFLSGPFVRLPRGEWDITASALFSEGGNCDGKSRELRATVRLLIG